MLNNGSGQTSKRAEAKQKEQKETDKTRIGRYGRRRRQPGDGQARTAVQGRKHYSLTSRRGRESRCKVVESRSERK